MDHTFVMISEAPDNLEFAISVQMLEIYNEKIKDLLDSKPFELSELNKQLIHSPLAKKNDLKIRNDKKRGLYVDGATEIYVTSADEMKETMLLGSGNRSVASTRMNAVSSRSHLIFMIKINKKDLNTGNTTDSKLYFVDLAGSEKMKKTEVKGKQLDEAKNINKSLTTLGLVINALVESKLFFEQSMDSHFLQKLNLFPIGILS